MDSSQNQSTGSVASNNLNAATDTLMEDQTGAPGSSTTANHQPKATPASVLEQTVVTPADFSTQQGDSFIVHHDAQQLHDPDEDGTIDSALGVSTLTTASAKDVVAMIEQLIHHVNITSNSLSAWRSYSNIARDKRQPLPAEPNNAEFFECQAQNLTHVLSGIHVITKRLHKALIGLEVHQTLRVRVPGYRSLINAATTSLKAVKQLPPPNEQMLRREKVVFVDPKPRVVESVHEIILSLIELCKGDAEKGIVGWTGVVARAKMYLGVTD